MLTARSETPRASAKSARTLWRVFIWAGWVIAILLAGIIIPRALKRARAWVPAVDRALFEQDLANKIARLREIKWQDPRPLQVWCGDSHVELGRWYELSAGAAAVRNAGLSRARIRDVEKLLEAVPDQPATIVLHCGINDLAGQTSVNEALEAYATLLMKAKSKASETNIYVLAVMPLSAEFGNERAQAVNEKVERFNEALKGLCARQSCVFIEVPQELLSGDRSLRAKFTGDGLHLNQDGYEALYRGLRSILEKE